MKKDCGFWDINKNYIQDIQEVNKMDMDKYFEELNDIASFKGFGEKPEVEEIIIDGVDISECEFGNACSKKMKCIILQDDVCEINPYCEGYNCYYKQLQRLQQENEELKAENERLQKLTCFNCGEETLSPSGAELYDKILVCKQTLQEIKAIVCGNYEIIDPQGRKDILKLITKAEEE